MIRVDWKVPMLSTVVFCIGAGAGIVIPGHSTNWWFASIAAALLAVILVARRPEVHISRNLLLFWAKLISALVGGLVTAVGATTLTELKLMTEGIAVGDSNNLLISQGIPIVLGIVVYFLAQVIEEDVALNPNLK